MAIDLPDGRRESNDVLAALRSRAVRARELGYAVLDIAAILGVREETVSRWCSRYHRGGREALPGDRTGRPAGSGRLLGGGQEQGILQAIETKTPPVSGPDRGGVPAAVGLHAAEAGAEGLQARPQGGGRMAGADVSGDRAAGG